MFRLSQSFQACYALFGIRDGILIRRCFLIPLRFKPGILRPLLKILTGNAVAGQNTIVITDIFPVNVFNGIGDLLVEFLTFLSGWNRRQPLSSGHA